MRLLIWAGAAALGAASVAAAPASAAAPWLIIDGGVPKPQTLSEADFKALPRTQAKWTVHGKTMTCEGPWLIDLLARVGVPTGDDVRGPALATLVIASASDGYRAAFTLGELDHKLGNAAIIVTDRCDGAALPASDGPLRIVAMADQRGARSVRSLVRLTLVQAPAVP